MRGVALTLNAVVVGVPFVPGLAGAVWPVYDGSAISVAAARVRLVAGVDAAAVDASLVEGAVRVSPAAQHALPVLTDLAHAAE